MSTAPSSLDGLLAEKKAEHMLTQQSGSLRVLLTTDMDTEAQMQSMCTELETPLLGDGGLGQFTEGLITDALSKKLEQQTAPRPTVQQTSFDDKLHGQATQRFPHRPTADASRRAVPGRQDEVEDTHQPQAGRPTASLSETESARRKPAGIQLNQTRAGEVQEEAPVSKENRPVTLRTNPYSSSGTDEEQDQQKQDQVKTLRSRKDNSKFPSGQSEAPHIDALQARDEMNQRVKKAGLKSAWNSPLNPPLPGQTNPPGRTQQSATVEATPNGPGVTSHGSVQEEWPSDKQRPLESPYSNVLVSNTATTGRVGATATEQQIELSLKKLHPQKYSQLNQTQWQRQRPQIASPPQQRPHSLQDEIEAPASPGGLRGLEARAKGPLNQSLPTQSAGNTPTGEHGPVPVQKSAVASIASDEKSGNSLAELNELLVEEARRAGIDLEQFRP